MHLCVHFMLLSIQEVLKINLPCVRHKEWSELFSYTTRKKAPKYDSVILNHNKIWPSSISSMSGIMTLTILWSKDFEIVFGRRA